MKQIIAWAAASVVLLTTAASGQVITDGTVGPAQSLAGPTFDITQDLGTTHGGNLFHSFSTFNIEAGQAARFSGVGVNNILARVTGGSASLINGTIQSTIDGANLFLINPSGVVFGPGAVLDVSGSFVVTTADFIELEDGVRFGSGTSPAVLSSAPPAAFGFLNPSPAGIHVTGASLQTPPGQALALVGGELRITSSLLVASEGQLNLLAVGSEGYVQHALSTHPIIDAARRADIVVRDALMLSQEAALVGEAIQFGWAEMLTGSSDAGVFAPTLLDATGDIVLAESNVGTLTATPAGQDLLVSGRSLTINADRNLGLTSTTLPGGKAGTITVDVGDGTLTILRGGQIYTSAVLGGDSGDVLIRAGTVTIDSRGRDALVEPVASVGSVLPGNGAAGQGGEINIDTGALLLRGGQISASSIAAGDSKPIRIHASGLIHISEDGFINGQTGSLTTPGAGRGGNIEITAQTLQID